MDERRKDLIGAASFLMVITVCLWLLSMQIDPDNNPNLRSMSLEEMDRAGVLSVMLRFGACAAGGLVLVCAAFLLPRPLATETRPRTSRVQSTLIATAISGIFCGIVCFVTPLNLAVGLVFGLCFAWVNLSKPRSIALYSVVSGLVYIVAYTSIQVAPPGLSIASPSSYLGLALAGAIGGLGLSVLTKLLARAPLALDDEVGASILGAIVAAPFILVRFLPVVGMALAFAFWQVPVGWYLSACLEKRLGYRSTLQRLE